MRHTARQPAAQNPASVRQPYVPMAAQESSDEIMTTQKLKDLLIQVSGADSLSRGVEEILFDVVNNFIENVTVGAAHLAPHRVPAGSGTIASITPDDVLLYLEQAYELFLVETDGHTFVEAATNPACRPPPNTSTIGVDEGNPHLITSGMGGTKHMERLSRIRALRKKRD